MSIKVASVLAVLVLASSSQAAFKEDLEQYLTPWINAAYSAKPLINLIFQEIVFLQKELLGLSRPVLTGILESTNQELIALENQVGSAQAKNCVKGFRSILRITSEKFNTDGKCFRIQQLKAENLIVPLFKIIFSAAPTPSCPIPIMCQLDILNFNPKKLRESMGVLKELHKNGLGLLKFIVYFKPEITACRNDAEEYKAVTDTLLQLAPICGK